MPIRALRIAGLATLAALTPTLAFAHTGVGEAHGLVHGFLHPVTGIDHVLAMVTVGLLAWQLGGRALWAVPATFVAVMAAGGGLGVAGIEVPFVELGIALSVVALGACVAFRVKAPLAIIVGLVGFFAIFQGYAHGAEMPEDAGGAAYGLGFMLGTALLHFAGIGVGYLIGRFADMRGPIWMRAAGGAVCLAGVLILVGVA
ncbi:HupE/UreJ family protein [Bosea sp. 117]|uniref:HupE/UreJ family protein n=1 Tax=Bosea sp. 117 TaxID=1125973 RepID=UPI0004948347|nr:HupE/UreJ family protein [Bosea sp. 117]